MADDLVITITECPRDAFQGFAKAAHLKRIIQAGISRIDFGSFVSHRAVPQMADTAELFRSIPPTRGLYLIAIVANLRGARDLVAANKQAPADGPRIAAAGFPLSVNETFQQHNTGQSLREAWRELRRIAGSCREAGVDLIGYLSMAFGNPYREPHEPQRVVDFAGRLDEIGAAGIQLADTVGQATPEQIGEIFGMVRAVVGSTPLGVHLHAPAGGTHAVATAALEAGCRMFDSALGGIGGCPFVGSELVGNIDTLELLALLQKRGYKTEVAALDLAESAASAAHLRSTFGDPIQN